MDTDPIVELVEALRGGRPPPLAWIVRWSRGGRDPVASAWRESTDSTSMIKLLELCGQTYLARRAFAACATLYGRVVSLNQHYVRAAAVRNAVGDCVPTLAEVLVACDLATHNP